MKLKLLALTLAVILLASPFACMVYAEETEPVPSIEGEEPVTKGEGFNETETLDGNGTEPVDLEVLGSLRNQTLGMSENILGYFSNVTFASGTLAPAILESLQHAQDAIEEGDSKNNTRAAAQMYLRAMKQYRNALRKYIHDNPGAADDFEPVNATEPEPDLNATTQEEIEAVREQLILRFQEQFRERLTLMYGNLDNITGSLTDADAVKAQNTIQKAEAKLIRIQERINNREFDEALDDLENATEGVDEGFNGMEDAFAGQMLRTMNKLEAKVQRMVEKQERKAARGEDTGELDGLIEELRGSIHSSRNDVKNGNGHGQDNDHGKPEKPDKGNKGKGNN